ncbi:MAG: helix-turn-helix domain-containing protein, partial [Betaproteobacteria bacterium]
MDHPPVPSPHHYGLVARAIGLICEAAATRSRQGLNAQLSLSELAQGLGLSEFHVQRVFQEWAGVSPKRFAQFLAKERAMAELREGATVLEAAHAAGLSGGGRLHDLMLTWEAMTPGEAHQGGAGLMLQWAWAATPVGWGLAALSPRGLCHL